MVVFDRPKSLIDVPFHYCPGCTHGIVHRLVAEAMDELGIEGKTIGIAPVGCAVMADVYKRQEPSEELKKEIQNYVKNNTAPYQSPRIVEFRAELPKTISGKLQRNKL